MRSMICQNGFVFVAAICLGLLVPSARGGGLDAAAAPTSSNSAMFTLNDIYNKIDTRTNVTKRAGGFTEPSGGPTVGTMRTLNEIMALVTNRAAVPKTGQTAVQYEGDDGWYSTNLGVALPNPRFTTNGVDTASNCVTDHLTGLMWLKNPDATTRNWHTAITYCEDLDGADGRGGYTDWRMPNLPEMFSLVDPTSLAPSIPPGSPFIGIISDGYNTSTENKWGYSYTWYVFMNGGAVNVAGYATEIYVWPVRGGK